MKRYSSPMSTACRQCSVGVSDDMRCHQSCPCHIDLLQQSRTLKLACWYFEFSNTDVIASSDLLVSLHTTTSALAQKEAQGAVDVRQDSNDTGLTVL